VLHHTLQQILKLVSFYTATDSETSSSFASRLVNNGLLHAANQDFNQALLQFIHAFTSSGIHAVVYNLKCLSCVCLVYGSSFLAENELLTLQTLAAVRAVLGVPQYRPRLDPS